MKFQIQVAYIGSLQYVLVVVINSAIVIVIFG